MSVQLAEVAGIDRWRGGWVVAHQVGGHINLRTAATIREVFDHLAECRVVAIDMPIALAEAGTRPAEAEVRAALGRSARSVFTSPTRAGVNALSQAQATEINRANGGPGISAQAFGLFASILELREALAGADHEHWWETHPETSFAIMNDGVPLASKRSARGVGQRMSHLRSHFPTVDELITHAPEKVPVDDVLDALAAAWSAQRIHAGDAIVYGPPGRDDQGFAEGIRI